VALVSFSSQAALKIAIVFDKGGKDDRSFNNSAYQGAMEAQKKLGAEIKYASAVDINAFETLLKGFAKKDFDLIVGIGVSQLDAMKKVAPQFPQKKFLIIDAEVTAPNVVSALFQHR
jgi:basic membrane protein A